jgi:hypothetical protein
MGVGLHSDGPSHRVVAKTAQVQNIIMVGTGIDNARLFGNSLIAAGRIRI